MSIVLTIETYDEKINFWDVSLEDVLNIEEKINSIRDYLTTIEKEILIFAFIDKPFFKNNNPDEDDDNIFSYRKKFDEFLESYQEFLYDLWRWEKIKEYLDYDKVKFCYDSGGNERFFIKQNGEFEEVDEGKYNNYQLKEDFE